MTTFLIYSYGNYIFIEIAELAIIKMVKGIIKPIM